MKKDIHPKWYDKTAVKCVCGNEFTTSATVPEIHVEVCSNCHSFYTGNQKVLDSAGRVTRYQERLARMKDFKKKTVAEKKDSAKKPEVTAKA